MRITGYYPPPSRGRIEVGVAMIWSPSPPPSPTWGEGDKRVIYQITPPYFLNSPVGLSNRMIRMVTDGMIWAIFALRY
jgi:hypothetical protein